MNEAGAYILGGATGITLRAGEAYIDSAGVISGQIAIYVLENASPGATAIDNLAGGTTQGINSAIAISTAGSFIFNEDGSIILGGSTGILLRTGDTFIQNAGAISDQVAIHVLESGSRGEICVLSNLGSIISTASGPGAYAIRINQTLYGEISNNGYIKGAIHNVATLAASLNNADLIDGDIFLISDTTLGISSYTGNAGQVNGTVYAVGSESELSGGDHTDRFVGFDGYDVFYGGGGKDFLNGGGGANFLHGGHGGDDITSGGAYDRFVYSDVSDSTSGAGADTLRGFDAEDVINLIDVEGATERRFIGSQAFFTDGTFQVRAVRTSSNAHTVYVDVDGDAVRDMTIFVRGQSALLSAEDFFL